MTYNLDIVNQLFSEFTCGVLENSGEYYVIVPKRDDVFTPKSKDLLSNNIIFYVDYDNDNNETLFIHFISNAIGISGKEILNRIERFCLMRNPKILKLSLEDDSFVMWQSYKIRLSHLNILKKGLSYYNEQGYLQETFSEYLSHWNALKDRKFLEVFNVNENIKRILSDSDTIKDVGEFLYDTIKNNKNIDPFIVIDLFDLCCTKIQYEHCQELTKKLSISS